HQVGPHLLFNHLGQSKNLRGGSSWNNYLKYDPDSQALFDEFTLYKNMNLVSSWINCMEIYVQDFSEGAIELRFFCLTCMKLKLMDFFHQVEGFFVISLRHPQSTIFKKGGSSLGCEFLEMIASTEEKYTVGHFHTWVAAQAIQILNGQQINAPNTKKQKTITAETLTTTT
ncbi:hypothetical protein VP01_1240g6, partial [Puccinia sorghi]